MTDKQIKISETKRYCEGIDCLWCDEKEPCIYRIANELEQQLKRKEQECEELRGVICKDICSHYVLGECSQKHHNNCVGRNQCIKDLEQECENNKTAYQMELDIYNQECFNLQEELKETLEQLDQLKAENEGLKNFHINLVGVKECEIKELIKYKQALTEIKDIVEFGFRPYKVCGEYNNCCDVLNEILQKISEVENERI